jgi:fermentation-respiration switch protein FrsA (DUF1100 family)
VDAFSQHPMAGPALVALRVAGVSIDQLRTQIAPVDPLTYADRLKAKKLLLIAASRDDVVPPAAMTALWQATGRPPILWVDSTHVGAAAHLLPAMTRVVEHLER